MKDASWLLIFISIVFFVLAALRVPDYRRASWIAWGLAFMAAWFAVGGVQIPGT